MRIHLIAVGGSVMHNLAIALKREGHTVTGSDDEIYEPSKSRLADAGLLPEDVGWRPERISGDIDLVILGMHARADNPELLRAQKEGVAVKSFPEYVGQRSKGKQKVVIAGSHGKTTTTSMIMHVLASTGRNFDWLVGAQLPQFDLMVRLSDAPVIIIEGDEYLSSAIDRRPKFLHYDADIAVLTGIAWDHKNVFPEYDTYFGAFQEFVHNMRKGTSILVYSGDAEAVRVTEGQGERLAVHNYGVHDHQYAGDACYLLHGLPPGKTPVRFFGRHNMQNVSAARLVCRELSVTDEEFFAAISSFRGASMRLQQIWSDNQTTVYRDFAHAPSKVKATVEAVRDRYEDQSLSAALELHTFSSLSEGFIDLYRDTLTPASRAFVYYSPHTFAMKNLPELDIERIATAFGSNVRVVTDAQSLKSLMLEDRNGIHLWMSSGRFGGLDIKGSYELDSVS